MRWWCLSSRTVHNRAHCRSPRLPGPVRGSRSLRSWRSWSWSASRRWCRRVILRWRRDLCPPHSPWPLHLPVRARRCPRRSWTRRWVHCCPKPHDSLWRSEVPCRFRRWWCRIRCSARPAGRYQTWSALPSRFCLWWRQHWGDSCWRSQLHWRRCCCCRACSMHSASRPSLRGTPCRLRWHWKTPASAGSRAWSPWVPLSREKREHWRRRRQSRRTPGQGRRRRLSFCQIRLSSLPCLSAELMRDWPSADSFRSVYSANSSIRDSRCYCLRMDCWTAESSCHCYRTW